MKYNFLRVVSMNPPVVELEKVPDFQIIGFPRGQDFEADVQHCTEIFRDAVGFYKDRPNAAHNKQQMIKAFKALGIPVPSV